MTTVKIITVKIDKDELLLSNIVSDRVAET